MNAETSMLRVITSGSPVCTITSGRGLALPQSARGAGSRLGCAFLSVPFVIIVINVCIIYIYIRALRGGGVLLTEIPLPRIARQGTACLI